MSGLVTAKLVLRLSLVRRRGGVVRLWKCGRLVLAADLSSEAASLRHVDLGGVSSLEGSIASVRLDNFMPRIDLIDPCRNRINNPRTNLFFRCTPRSIHKFTNHLTCR
jgi:hypothetical protein